MTQLESKSPTAPAPVSADRRTEAATSSPSVRPLAAERLYRAADLSALSFESTADIEPADGLVGQQRALDAIEFGTRIGKPGFNLFRHRAERHARPARHRAGTSGGRRRAAPPVRLGLRQQLRRSAQACGHRIAGGTRRRIPRCHARAHRRSQDDITGSIRKRGLPDTARRHRSGFPGQAGARRSRPCTKRPRRKNIVILRTPMGFALAPARDGKPVPPDEFRTWPEAKRKEIQATIEAARKGPRTRRASTSAMGDGAARRTSQTQS